MKLWVGIFIGAYIALYGTVSLILLGSWIYETAKALRGDHQPVSR